MEGSRIGESGRNESGRNESGRDFEESGRDLGRSFIGVGWELVEQLPCLRHGYEIMSSSGEGEKGYGKQLWFSNSSAYIHKNTRAHMDAHTQQAHTHAHVLVLCPTCVHLSVRNSLVNEVEFLGFITQKWYKDLSDCSSYYVELLLQQ